MVENEKLLVSIDFGMCNLKGSYNHNGNVRAYPFAKMGKTFFPNIVSVAKNDINVGTRYGKSTKRTDVSNLKRHLEEENWKVYVESRSRYMTAAEIAEEEFAWIKQTIEKKLHKPVSEAILTVPVCFSELQVKRLCSCAVKAGIPVKDIIIEPLASLFSYSDLYSSDDEYNILVFDFGGGTLDTSIFNISPSGNRFRIETCAAAGIHIGGNDITELIYSDMLADKHPDALKEAVDIRFRSYLNNDDIPDADKKPDSPVYIKNYKRQWEILSDELKYEINEFKENICSGYDDDEPLEFIPAEFPNIAKLELTYSYQELCSRIEDSGIADEVRKLIDTLLERSGLLAEEIDKVLMVGGSSRIPFFAELVKSCLETDSDDIFCETEKDKFDAVACGAERYFLENDVKFEMKNRLSYEIGVISGGKYERCRSIDTFVGNKSRRRVSPVLFPDGTLRVRMYQVFHDTAEYGIDIERDPVYMGYFLLDSSRYSEGESYIADFRFEKDGRLYADFHDADGNSEPLEIIPEE